MPEPKPAQRGSAGRTTDEKHVIDTEKRNDQQKQDSRRQQNRKIKQIL
jgi:hypothetical protein